MSIRWQLLYTSMGITLSIYFWPVASRRIDLNVRSDRGFRFCGWNKAGLNYFCISEMSSIALEAFEDEVREHTNM
jgi:hypothetical protein